jgi:hypothetical protein
MSEETSNTAKTDTGNTGTLRERFAELKKKLAALPTAERVAQEVRLAREAGITVTATEAASIARPIERLHRLHDDLAAAVLAPAAAPCMLEGGQGIDLDSRNNFADAVRETGLLNAASAGQVREMIQRMTEGNPAALEDLLTRATPHLELLATCGEHAGLLAQARDAVAKLAFGHIDPAADRNGAAGTRNT